MEEGSGHHFLLAWPSPTPLNTHTSRPLSPVLDGNTRVGQQCSSGVPGYIYGPPHTPS